MGKIHTVQQGECLLSIAARFGFSRWQTIYDHPANAELRRARPNPNVLYPGDRIHIPDKRRKEVPRQTGMVHSFTLTPAPCLLRLVVQDEDRRPLGGKRYELRFAGAALAGVTPATGRFEHSIAATVQRAELRVWLGDGPDDPPDHCFDLAVGGLDPVTETSGVQARLHNLGHRCEIDGELGPRTAAALAAFQEACGREPTGALDDATRAALLERHEDV